MATALHQDLVERLRSIGPTDPGRLAQGTRQLQLSCGRSTPAAPVQWMLSTMMKRLRRCLLVLSALLLCAGPLPAAWAQGRGELLYNTHCVACHSTQMHWRDKRQVVDWPSLRAQVRLWQATGLLAWDEADIDHVARYLNDTYYRYPNPAAGTTGPLAQR